MTTESIRRQLLMNIPGIEKAFHGAATVGERGQVVIPASAREELGISAGDKLLVFVHPSGSGVFFVKLADLQQFAQDLAPFVESLAATAAAPDDNGSSPRQASE